MPPPMQEPSGVPPDLDTTAQDDAEDAALAADLDARYAAYLEEVVAEAADVNNPIRAAEARDELAWEPDEHRYAWELSEALLQDRMPPPGFTTMLILQLGAVVIAVTLLVGWLL